MPVIIDQNKVKRAALIKDARKIYDAADTAKRSMTGEETQEFDRLMAESDALNAEAEKLQKDEERRSILSKHEGWLNGSAGRRSDPADPSSEPGKKPEKLELEFRSQPGSGRQYDNVEFGPDTVQFKRSTAERRSTYSRWLANGKDGFNENEYRDLQADSDTAGGFLQSPLQMVQILLKFVDNAVIVRQYATVYQVPTAQSLGVPSLDTDVDDADWTAELATGKADAGIAFGRRELHPKPLAKRIRISNKLLRSAVIGPESIVRDRLGYKFGVAQEKGFMTGSGSNQPLGLFTASALGISTARDVNTKNTTTAITADGLIEAKYFVKPQYQKTGQWVFHRTAMKNIRQLKDGNGQYLWMPGLAGGQADTLLDRPVLQSEYAPNTFTTGQYVGLFGDLRQYWIADSLQLEIQRLNELYAETNQVGFIGRQEVDGMPVLEEAFARVTLA